MNRWMRVLKDRWLDVTDSVARFDLPPFVKLGLLIAVAVLPFAAFVALQEDPEEEPEPAPVQRAIDTSQRFPLVFPFGGGPDPVTPVEEPEIVEMSPSPEPTRSPAVTQCNNGRDDDRDGKIDLRDPGCSSRTDRTESPDPASPKPPAAPTTPPAPVPTTPPSPTPSPAPSPPPSPPPKPECSDGIDNDGDEDIDGEDFWCKRNGPSWDNEDSGRDAN